MMFLMILISVTEVIAIWGAVLSSVLAAIRVHEYVRDQRPHIRVVFSPRVFRGWEMEECIQIEAVNTGKKPVTITALALRLDSGDSLFFARPDYHTKPMPAKLEESEGVSAFIPRREADAILTKVKWAYARANDGNVYRSRRFKAK